MLDYVTYLLGVCALFVGCLVASFAWLVFWFTFVCLYVCWVVLRSDVVAYMVGLLCLIFDLDASFTVCAGIFVFGWSVDICVSSWLMGYWFGCSVVRIGVCCGVVVLSCLYVCVVVGLLICNVC